MDKSEDSRAGSVLVVDDEASVRESLGMILEYEGYDVRQASNGREALEAVDTAPPDLVILDVKMPEMDGLATLRALKARGKDVPTIMISGHADVETAVEATRMGAFDFFEKPLERERLLLSLRNALASSRQSSAGRARSEDDEDLRTDVPTHTDEPAIRTDLLGRKAMARFLAEDLRRIRSENNSSYVLHLHGPWGSGKTSLLNFIKNELENPSRSSGRDLGERRWVVIDFNVWRHERFGSPWWWMMEALASQAPQRLRELGHPWRAFRLRLAHWKWKNLTGRGLRVASIGVLAAMSIWGIAQIEKWFSLLGAAGASDALTVASKALAAGSVIVGAIIWLIRNTARSSARAIGQLIELSENPVHYLKAHFEGLVSMLDISP